MSDTLIPNRVPRYNHLLVGLYVFEDSLFHRLAESTAHLRPEHTVPRAKYAHSNLFLLWPNNGSFRLLHAYTGTEAKVDNY